MNLADFPTIRVAAVDLNGQLRGKRMPGTAGAKLDQGGARMPFSALNLDITGADIEGSPLVFASGDADGVLLPTGRGAVPMPWLESASALVPMWMFTDDRAPCEGDPRHALDRVLDRYAERGWSVLAAIELEFYLAEATGEGIAAPRPPQGGGRLDRAEILSLAGLDAFDGFFTALYQAAKAMGIDAQTSIAEAGVGQYEINLNHTGAMRAADDAVLFKHMVKGLARVHGMAATFMAKPYPDQPGNGAHVHFSVVDETGTNIFDDGTETGNDTLRHAVGGRLKGMVETSLLFLPHGASYDRLAPGAHAPTAIGWGYENRTAAILIPGGSPRARRIEHRVAGGDICPYLMLAGVLGAAMIGIEDGAQPPEPLTGNAYDADLPQIPTSWDAAIDALEASAMSRRIFPEMLIENLVLTKRQEAAIMADCSAQDRLRIYLERV